MKVETRGNAGRRYNVMIDWIRSVWCRSMHRGAMWPMHGKYICPRCLCEYPVVWEAPAETGEYGAEPLPQVAGTAQYAQHRLC